MYDDYCYRCGAYTSIDRLTKMCGRCYDLWRTAPRLLPASAGRNP
jgi:NMD protein affecting ribosome stability and mRNA decay